MRTTVNLLILNNAVADLLTTLVGGMELMNTILNNSAWIQGFIGDLICKFVFCCMYAGSISSLDSLLAISIDRYLAVTRPLQYKATTGYLKYVIYMIWLFSFLVGGIVMFTYGLDNSSGENKCTFISKRIAGTICVCTNNAVPLVIMATLYTLIGCFLCTRRVPGQTNRDIQTAMKATKMMVAVMLVFLVSWTPSILVDCVTWVSLKPKTNLHAITPIPVYYLFVVSHGFLNLCVYVKLNEKFRKGFFEIPESMGCKTRRSVQQGYSESRGDIELGQVNQRRESCRKNN
jgi:hypothetical protein